MRRMSRGVNAPPGNGGSGAGAIPPVASYTNLAALASAFESSYQRHVVVAGASPSGTSSPKTLHQQAMQLVQQGLRVDEDNPEQAVMYYQQGVELLSRALQDAPSDGLADEMQRSLDMVTERLRTIARERLREGGAVSRSSSGSEFTEATPSGPVGLLGLPETEVDVVRPKPVQPPAAVAERERAYNYFDMSRPATLPIELRVAYRSIGGQFETLMRQFGFQTESAANQMEHLALLLANSASHAPGPQDGAGLAALHRKLLANYILWARQIGTTPQCAAESDVSAHKTADLVLYLCIWGEAANLRHVPEALCFLFHQMRAELWVAAAAPAARPPRPQGWFLSQVVAPLYALMRCEMNRRDARGKPLGHTRKCNYDDFNEYFWDPACLGYRYYSLPEGEAMETLVTLEAMAEASAPSLAAGIDQAVGLAQATARVRPARPTT